MLSAVLTNMMGTETFEIIIQITAVSLLFVIIIFNDEMYQTESFRE